MKKLVAGVAIVASMGLTACVSSPVSMGIPSEHIDAKKYQVLGEGEGSSVGVMLFNIIPINQNERFQKAYDEAVLSRGGDRLLNPTIEERWFWGYVLNGYIFKVRGTVVKDLQPVPVSAPAPQ